MYGDICTKCCRLGLDVASRLDPSREATASRHPKALTEARMSVAGCRGPRWKRPRSLTGGLGVHRDRSRERGIVASVGLSGTQLRRHREVVGRTRLVQRVLRLRTSWQRRADVCEGLPLIGACASRC